MIKIVTLLPSATEIACALSLKNRLVAVSHECDYPPSVTALPPITSSILPHDLNPKQIDEAVITAVHQGQALYQVNGDLLAQLQPDLIITQGVCDVCAVNQGTVEQTIRFLDDVVTNSMQILTLSGQNFAGMLRDIRLVGEATGRGAEATMLIGNLRQRWTAVQANQPAHKPRVAMIEWPDPFFYGGHWVPEMVEAAGGIDVLGAAGMPSGRCTADEIVAQDPEIIISIACGYDLAKNVEFAQQIMENPAFEEVTAVRTGNVWAADANGYFSRPAPRLVGGAEMLQAIFTNDSENYADIRRVKTCLPE